jgi:Immunity protein 26
MMADTFLYAEGTVFAIPLRNGGYARGVVARAAPEEACVFGYFFGPKQTSVDNLGMDDMLPENAILSGIFGDLGLMNGEWQVIGSLLDWQREEWPMPDFVRRDPIGKRAWRVHYSDVDPSVIESEEPTSFDTNLPPNVSSGYGSIELKLTKLLSLQTPVKAR